jgi:hypothetical protein
MGSLPFLFSASCSSTRDICVIAFGILYIVGVDISRYIV